MSHAYSLARLARTGIITVDNLQALGALIAYGGVPPSAVFVKGFRAPKDGGGGVFYWDASVPGTAHDGGLVLAPGKFNQLPVFPGSWFTPGTSALGCWVREDVLEITPTMFGALGDGTTNDYQAVQTAINIAGRTKAVVFDKSFRIGSPLFPKAGAYLKGSTGATYYFTNLRHIPHLVCGFDDPVSALIEIKEINAGMVTLENLNINMADRNTVAVMTCLQKDLLTRAYVRANNVVAHNCAGPFGFWLGGGYAHLTNVRVLGPSAWAANVSNAVGIVPDSVGIFLNSTDSIVFACETMGGFHIGLVVTVNACYITNYQSDQCNVGYSIGASKNHFIGCRTSFCYQSGFDIGRRHRLGFNEAYGNVFAGCTVNEVQAIKGDSLSQRGPAFRFIDEQIPYDNTFVGCRVYRGFNSIEVYGGVRNAFSGMVFTGIQGAKLYISPTAPSDFSISVSDAYETTTYFKGKFIQKTFFTEFATRITRGNIEPTTLLEKAMSETLTITAGSSKTFNMVLPAYARIIGFASRIEETIPEALEFQIDGVLLFRMTNGSAGAKNLRFIDQTSVPPASDVDRNIVVLPDLASTFSGVGRVTLSVLYTELDYLLDN